MKRRTIINIIIALIFIFYHSIDLEKWLGMLLSHQSSDIGKVSLGILSNLSIMNAVYMNVQDT